MQESQMGTIDGVNSLVLMTIVFHDSLQRKPQSA